MDAIRLVGAIALLVPCLVGCSDDIPREIRVGFVSAGTNPNDPSRAAQLAVRELNANGGIDDRLVSLSAEISSLDPIAASSSVRHLIHEGCLAIVGPQSSAELTTVGPIVADAQVPTIGFNATSAFLSMDVPEYSYVFRTAPSDIYQARLIASRALGRWNCSTLALLAQTDAYGQPLADEIARYYTQGGRTIVAREDIDANTADYRDALDRIDAATPDCVVLAAFGTPSARILAQWNDGSARTAVRWVGTESHRTQVFLDAVTDLDWIDGMVGTDISPASSTPQYEAFRSRFVATYGIEPEPVDGRKYDATALALLAIAATHGARGATLRQGVFDVSRPPGTSVGPGQLATGVSILARGGDVDYIGASGSVDLDDVGDVLADYLGWRFDSSVPEYVTEEIVSASSIPVDP